MDKKLEEVLVKMVAPTFNVETFQKAVEDYAKAKLEGQEETATLRFIDMVDNACYFLRIKGIKELNGRNFHLEIG